MKPIFSDFIPTAPSSAQSSGRVKFINNTTPFIPDLEPKYQDKKEIMVYLEFHYKSDVIKDIDNTTKATLDVMKKRIYWDDDQIVELHAKVKRWSDRTGVMIKVFELSTSD